MRDRNRAEFFRFGEESVEKMEDGPVFDADRFVERIGLRGERPGFPVVESIAFRPFEQAGEAQLQYGIPVRHGVFIIGPELSQPGRVAAVDLLFFFRCEEFRHPRLNRRGYEGGEEWFCRTGGNAGKTVTGGEFDLYFSEDFGERSGLGQRRGQGLSLEKTPVERSRQNIQRHSWRVVVKGGIDEFPLQIISFAGKITVLHG